RPRKLQAARLPDLRAQPVEQLRCNAVRRGRDLRLHQLVALALEQKATSRCCRSDLLIDLAHGIGHGRRVRAQDVRAVGKLRVPFAQSAEAIESAADTRCTLPGVRTQRVE